VLVFCYVICAFAAAVESSSKGYGFVAIWSMLVTLAFSAGGTLILRRLEYRTPLAVGFMIGVGAMQANEMLVVAVVSGSNLAKFGVGAMPPGEGATQAFAVLLLMAYASFTGFTLVYRDTLLPPPMAGADAHDGLPPGQAVPASYDAGGAGPQFSDAPAGAAVL